MTYPTPAHNALAQLWHTAGLDPAALHYAHFTGSGPGLPSSFAVGVVAQATIGAAALAAASLWQQRTGAWQTVTTDLAHAVTEFRSERYQRVNGQPAPELWNKIAGLYPCGDGGWVRLHTNFPHHRDGVLQILQCADSKEAVAEALLGWQAAAFEDEAARRGLVVTMMRSFAEWDAHPQAAAIAALPIFSIERIGDAPPQPLPPGAARPLSGVRVLDLTRIIAGPVGGRTLAAHGADVLLVNSPNLPTIDALNTDMVRGKHACYLNLTTEADRAQLTTLARGADVFIQGYRPGGLDALGFGPEALAAQRPGLVYVSLTAYGHTGPWAARRGFDSLVQTASGINHAEAAAAGSTTPKPLPAQALDHGAGYLIALGAMAALHRRASEGGSWHVRVSLAQTGRWLRSLGQNPAGLACPDPQYEDVQAFMETHDSTLGEVRTVRHAAQLSATPAGWSRPAVALGSDAASWW